MIFGTLNANGTFYSIEQGSTLPAGAVEITAADALAMSQGRGHPCYKPSGSGGIMLDQAAADSFDLEYAKAAKKQELNDACRVAITGGFQSSALGTVHTYDSTLEDQLNLEGLVSSGVDTPFRCTDSAGIKSFVLHTAAELSKVKVDGVAFKMGHLVHCDTLKAQVEAATTVAAVTKVKW